MVIRNNVMGLRAYNANRKTTGSIKKNLEKLSSGYRINRAADDAAGLGVSERIRAKITELGRCGHNAEEGMDLAKTADAALQEVNDMLKRARSLCIEAANGTYSDQELTAISDEMNHLFDEIDRISAGSYHNSICLFRGEIEEDYHFEYDERFDALGPDELELWGEMDFVQTEDFNPATQAAPATAIFKLGDAIDFNNSATLEGRSIKIGDVTYYFTSQVSYPGDTTRCAIGVGPNAVEDALKRLAASPKVASVTVDKDARTVTLTAPLTTLSETVYADGKTIISEAPNGDGASGNGVKVQNPMGSAPLMMVDGSGGLNNMPVYDSKITVSYSLNKLPATLSQTDVDNLKRNTLHVANSSITFGDATNSTGTQVAVSAGMTKKQVGDAVAGAIQNLSKLTSNSGYTYTATFDEATSKLNVTIDGRSTTEPTGYLDIYESSPSVSSSGYDYDTANRWTSTGANLAVQITRQATMETGEQCTITIPQNLNAPFSFQINGTSYLYYNSDDNPLTTPGHSSTQYSSGTPVRYDTKGKTADQIRADIIGKITTYANNNLKNTSVSVNGNVVTLNSSTPGYQMDLSTAIKPISITVTPYQYTPSTSGTKVLSTSDVYFQQKFSVSFSLGGSFDKDALVGRGFSVSGGGTTKYIEFTAGGAGLSGSHTDVNISGCTSFDELKTAVQNAIGSTYTVSIDNSDPANVKLTLSGSRSTGTSRPTVIDGNEGIATGSVIFEGGANTNHSQKSIDFSSINEDNLDTLLGKGFRINCATCSGEYINVFFCWTNNGSVPLTFEKEDPVTGEIRTIHNIAVELSKITSGDKIVESIVNQVRPSLNHYTDVAVGDPPTTLIAMEKRVGDVRDNAGTLYLGQIQTGVEANFTYSVELKKVLDFAPDGSVNLKTADVNIYVGSDPKPQIVPIHLPYIDLNHLRLRPPERVDLTDPAQDPSDWLSRVDRADLAISNARGAIGADYNRLEHAIQDLSNTRIQLSDAYSVIRDADVAELMMKQVRDQILVQTQQSMLSQANQVPQGVLQLIQ